MRNTRNGLFTLAVLGGIFAYRNRFAIQRRLESFGIRTPLLPGSLDESARSVAAKVSGKMERGATIAEDLVNRRFR